MKILAFVFITVSLYAQTMQKGTSAFPITVEGQLGHQYYRGYSLDSKNNHEFNPKRGINLLKTAVVKHDVLAMFDLYEVYQKGIYGEDVDKKRANMLLKNSIKGIEILAENGNTRATFYLGEIYKNGLLNYEVDITKAFDFHNKAAQEENPLAWFSQAFFYRAMYEYNDRDIKYIRKAIQLYEKALKRGLRIAAREVGILYHGGKLYKASKLEKAKVFSCQVKMN